MRLFFVVQETACFLIKLLDILRQAAVIFSTMPLQGAKIANTGTNEQDISFWAAMIALYSTCIAATCGIVFFFSFSHTPTFQLLDKPWSLSVVPSLPPGSCLQFLSRIGSNPTARRFFIEYVRYRRRICCLLLRKLR